MRVYVKKEEEKTSNCFVVTSKRDSTIFQLEKAESIYNLEKDPYFQQLLRQRRQQAEERKARVDGKLEKVLEAK